MNRRLKRFLGGSLVLAVLGVAGFIAFQVVAGAGEGPARPGYLLASNRTHLSLCVDGAAGRSITSQELDVVSAAVDGALGSLDEVPPEFGEPSVTAGCPPAIPLTGERLDSFDLHSVSPTRVRDPDLLSPHRVFVYFVPDDMFAASFGERPSARVPAEMLCHGDACGEMTVSIYLPSSAGADVTAEGILRALALHPREPEPAFDPRSCELGTPIAGCNRYLACIAPTPEPWCDEEFWREIGLEPPQ